MGLFLFFLTLCVINNHITPQNVKKKNNQNGTITSDLKVNNVYSVTLKHVLLSNNVPQGFLGYFQRSKEVPLGTYAALGLCLYLELAVSLLVLRHFL